MTFTPRPTAAYRALELAVPTAWLGVVGACFAVVPLVLAVPSWQATDRFAWERRVMLAGSALMLGSAGVFVLLGNSITGWSVGSVVWFVAVSGGAAGVLWATAGTLRR